VLISPMTLLAPRPGVSPFSDVIVRAGSVARPRVLRFAM